MLRTPLLLFALCTAAAGCASDDDVIYDCYGGLGVSIPLTAVPQHVAIWWNGALVVNECDGTSSVTGFAKQTDSIYVERIGIGYTVPAELNIVVKDLADCRQAGAVIAERSSPFLGRPTCREEYVTLTP